MEHRRQNSHKEISRREFLQSAGTAISGATLASLALSSGCKDTGTSSAVISGTGTPTSSPATSPSVTQPANTIINNVPYLDPDSTPGCGSIVAADRLYSIEHIWVKDMGDNTVQIGISEKYLAFVGEVILCYIPDTGAILHAGDDFGTLQGLKMTADLISPVSGEITGSNQLLKGYPKPLTTTPYTRGWLLNIKLSNPDELHELVSPRYYAYLQSTGWTAPVPSEH